MVFEVLVSMVVRTVDETDAQAVLKRLRATYAKVRTAKMTLTLTVGDGAKPDAVVTLQYKSPNLIWARTTSKVKFPPSFTYMSDGVNLFCKGRPEIGKKKFSLQAVQDDGPPVFKETLALWDARQFGERAAQCWYKALKRTIGGAAWIELREAHRNGDGYGYFIEGRSGLIKRTV